MGRRASGAMRLSGFTQLVWEMTWMLRLLGILSTLLLLLCFSSGAALKSVADVLQGIRKDGFSHCRWDALNL